MRKLRLQSLTFVNPDTGEKTESVLAEDFQLELIQPFCDDLHSATFLSGAILAGAYGSTLEYHSPKEE